MNDAAFLSVLRTKIGNLIKLSKGRSVFLYGAGHGGELCLKELTDSEICPEGFIDKKAGLMEDYCKLPVVSLNAITPENAFIIVSLLTYKSEIDTLLSKSGFLRDEDYVFVIDRNEKVNSCISVYDFSSTLTTLDEMQSVKELDDFMKVNSEWYLCDLFWKYRDIALGSKDELQRRKANAKCHAIQEHFNARIPVKTDINRFDCPHGFKGIFISEGAKIGQGCTIFQNVTIGSNTLIGSKGEGFPIVEDNVFLGVGSAVIGNVRIGKGVRIGANCTVVEDVPAGCLVVTKGTSVIQKGIKDSKFLSANDYRRAKDNKVVELVKHTGVGIPCRTINSYKKQELEKAFRITFSGDLILLEDQVKLAASEDGYDFNPIFELVKPYIQDADLAIGVFEGPLGGHERGYSTGNFDDGKKLRLNYPDEYAIAVKTAGYDVVTNANNHLFDAGEDGVLRTITALDDIGLLHVGSYKTLEEKKNNRVRVIEKNGIKFAILAYTYGVNNCNIDDFIYGKYAYATSIIYGVEGERFERQKIEVEQDFRRARELGADFVIVLPHWGTEFTNYPDKFQDTWSRIFIENGADIILGDHTHTVQPIKIIKNGDKNVFLSYSPGNLCNVYRAKQGDTSMLVDVYIDKEKKQIIGGSIVPLYSMASMAGNFKAIPIWDLRYNEELKEKVSSDDMVRIEKAHDIITKVVLETELDISSICKRYFFDDIGYLRVPKEYKTELKEGTFYHLVSKNEKICFIGDSITEGTFNGGVPWYEPIQNEFKDKAFSNISKGSATVSSIVEKITRIPDSDLYVVAIGTNDVRYRDPLRCAMTAQEYVDKIDILRYGLKKKKPDCHFVFIAPWYSSDGDPYTSLTYDEKLILNKKYSEALLEYCKNNGDTYIDPNEHIKRIIDKYPQKMYLVDHIHPNADYGVVLYSEAVMAYMTTAG